MAELWSRRTGPSKLSLSTPGSGQSDSPLGRSSTTNLKRFGGDSSSLGKSPFGSITPGGTLASPTSAAASAFALGHGAFAAFGSVGSAKTPKSPGNPFDTALGAASKTPTAEKSAKEGGLGGSRVIGKSASNASLLNSGRSAAANSGPTQGPHPLRNSFVFWFRPPISKVNGFIEYEKTLHPIATVETVEQFFAVYQHLKRPSDLPLVSDYHLFKKGVRPIWEDDENKAGGKWVIRLRKGVADRYWEDLLLAIIGDQFGEDGEQVCGAVLSVRNGEDILSIWTRIDSRSNIKVKNHMQRILQLPPDTKIDWKSHDSSIAQRTAIEESRRDKANNHGDRRTNKQNHHHQQTQLHSADDLKSL
ncbi:translation initiation factor eIF 4e-like domain-containing protein [Podospora fimiseda]|uniref:Translation initiation factor eIF 4e-like domain-containing protein n=1 Tax=Podospora fimiseda TaxID=252190 RepID=A0AAN7H5V6_9PEZI|nr:translation initiation factor eIF 4e-like domain-containing protein [Podospora fimiseda]